MRSLLVASRLATLLLATLGAAACGAPESHAPQEASATAEDLLAADYTLVSTFSGLAVEVTSGSREDAARVVQRKRAPHGRQRWSFEPAGDGTYALRARHSGKCLDVLGYNDSNGALVGQWSCNGEDNQRWRITRRAGGYELRSAWNGRCLDILGKSRVDGGSVGMWNCNQAVNQVFALTRVAGSEGPPTGSGGSGASGGTGGRDGSGGSGSSGSQGGGSSGDSCASGSCPRHLWIWGDAVATNSSERDALFAFAAQKRIGTLYLDSGALLAGDTPALGDFIEAARGRGIEVELVFGAADWALTENHAVPVAIARSSVAFVQSLKTAGRPLPTSIQLDVEPYSLSEWARDQQGTAAQLVDMYEKLAGITASTGLSVTACIPRWFDGVLVTRNGVNRPLSEWIADASNRVALMDYVDNATSIIDDAANEIAYATKTGKQVVIGVETIPALEPESVTFAEEGETAMDSALLQVVSRYRGESSFRGVAIHHYDSFRSMAP
jgi:hypothetical protein